MKSRFKVLLESAKKWILAHKLLTGAIIVVVLILVSFVVGIGNGKNYIEQTITKKPFVQRVSVSGKVTSPEEVSMAFDTTGRIARIYAAVGDTVVVGSPLVGLSLGTLAADLERARATVAVKSIADTNSGVDVDGALRTLLSEGLVAVPSSDNYTVSAPIITGVYNSKEQGTYKLIIKRVTGGSNDFELRVFGLESTSGHEKISDVEPTALGTRGLYISFPEDTEAYSETTWYVQIPNVKSTAYLDNYNAYQQALRNQDQELQTGAGTVAQAELLQAKAELYRIETLISQMTLRAPFDGKITKVDGVLGSAVSINDPVVSLISNETLEIESFVPEINISHLAVGDLATVTLDAYGDATPFSATVVSIDPAETVRDGVTTYRIILHFVALDERIRSGMTANVIITTDERDNVISVPQGVIENKNGKRYVTVLEGSRREKREVLTGAVSALGEIEILQGLNEGEVILVEAPE